MTSKIESTKREMYRALKALKAGGRWLLKRQNAEAFESALEEHLEAASEELAEMTRLRKCFETLAVDYTKKSVSLEEANKSLEMRLGYALRNSEVLSDAYDQQKLLTHNACVEAREYWDRAFHAEREAKIYMADCISAEASADRLSERVHQQKVLIAAQRNAISDLYMTNRLLVRQVQALADEADLLKSANRVAGEELRNRKYPCTPGLLSALGITAGELLENVQSSRYENG